MDNFASKFVYCSFRLSLLNCTNDHTLLSNRPMKAISKQELLANSQPTENRWMVWPQPQDHLQEWIPSRPSDGVPTFHSEASPKHKPISFTGQSPSSWEMGNEDLIDFPFLQTLKARGVRQLQWDRGEHGDQRAALRGTHLLSRLQRQRSSTYSGRWWPQYRCG